MTVEIARRQTGNTWRTGPVDEGSSEPFAEGEGSPLTVGVDAIWAIGFLTATPADGQLVLAVNGVQVSLPAAVVDDPVNQDAASYFAAAGFTVTVEAYSGDIDGYSFTFGGGSGERPITFTIVLNTIVNGSEQHVALDPADPVEVQAGSLPPTVGDRYRDTLNDVIWTYTSAGWTGVGVLDYVEVAANPPITFDHTLTPLIASNEVVVDGQTAIVVELYIPALTVNKGDLVNCGWNLVLFDGATEIDGIATGDVAPNFVDAVTLTTHLRTPSFAPTAGPHTYTVKVNADAGGDGFASSNVFPMYLRVSLA